MPAPLLASKFAEWAAISVTAIGGGIWLGNVQTEGVNNSEDIAALQPVATEVAKDISKLEERTVQMQQGINDIKAQQNNILLELRKR